MKACPFCAEEIQDAAVFCRHCHHDLKTGAVAGQQVVVAAAPQRRWSPGVAGLLSFLIPGTGLMYKGQVGAGIVMFILTVVGYFVFVLPGLVLHLVTIAMSVSGDPMQDPAAPAPRPTAEPTPSIRISNPATPDQVRSAKRWVIGTGAAFVVAAGITGALSWYADRALRSQPGEVGAAAARSANEALSIAAVAAVVCALGLFVALIVFGDRRGRLVREGVKR